MKIVIDVPADQSGLDTLGKLGQIEIARFEWPEVEAPARVLDPGRIRDADALFCSSPPFPNVILTPHISGAADNRRFQERLWDLFVKNAERFAGDRPLLNELTAAQLNSG